MDKPIKITFDPAKMKPIRCKGRYKGSYASDRVTRPVGGQCGNILAITDGETIIESAKVAMIKTASLSRMQFASRWQWAEVNGISAILITAGGQERPRTFTRRELRGQSLVYRCMDCGTERKIVGFQYVFTHIENHNDLFDKLAFSQ